MAFAPKLSQTLEEVIGARIKHLVAYQNTALAYRYQELVEKVRAVDDARSTMRTRKFVVSAM